MLFKHRSESLSHDVVLVLEATSVALHDSQLILVLLANMVCIVLHRLQHDIVAMLRRV